MMGVEKMYNIAFTQDKTRELNERVAEYIAPHLFVFCNYNPESIKALSNDAKFILSVMNMYKLLVDASVCLKLVQIAKDNYINADFQVIRHINNAVDMLRTVFGHNLDENNGNDDEKKMMKKWFRTLIKKDLPATEEDYKIALDEMERYGDMLYDVLNDIINKISKSDRKKYIIESWEQAIIQFYKRPTSINIIEGQLYLAYQARNYSLSNKPSKFDVASWVKDRVCYPEETQNENFGILLRRKGMTSSAIEKITVKIEENKKSLLKKQELVAKTTQKEVDRIGPYDYLHYYAREMAKKIETKIKNENVTSLLPQDIIQELIEEEFSVML